MFNKMNYCVTTRIPFEEMSIDWNSSDKKLKIQWICIVKEKLYPLLEAKVNLKKRTIKLIVFDSGLHKVKNPDFFIESVLYYLKKEKERVPDIKMIYNKTEPVAHLYAKLNTWLDRGGNPNILYNESGNIFPAFTVPLCGENEDLIRKFLLSGVDPYVFTLGGQLPIDLAVRKPSCLKILLDFGVDPNRINFWGYNAAFTALVLNNIISFEGVIKKMDPQKLWLVSVLSLEYQADPNYDLNDFFLKNYRSGNLPKYEEISPYMAIIFSRKPQEEIKPFLELLYKNGFLPPHDLTVALLDANHQILFEWCIREGLISINPGEESFIELAVNAIRSDKLQFLELFLSLGLDPNAKISNGMTLLQYATRSNHPQSVSILLNYIKNEFLEEPFLENLSEEVFFRSMIAHRFGVPVEMPAMVGHEKWLIKYEGVYGRIPEKHLPAEWQLSGSVNAFFEAFPTVTSEEKMKRIKENTYMLNADEACVRKAADAARAIRQNQLTALACRWPGHFAYLIFSNELCFVCNRGGLREEGVSAGIQVFTVTCERAINTLNIFELTTDPSLIADPNKRQNCGLSRERVRHYGFKEQSGGFCRWQNLKTALWVMIFLSEFEPSDQIYNDKDRHDNAMHTTTFLYKKWSAFDRERVANTVLERYIQDSSKEPDWILLTYLVAHLPKGKTLEDFSEFFEKKAPENLKLEVRTLDKKNIFHHIRSSKSLKTLKKIAKEKWENLVQELMPLKDEFGRSPLIDAIRNQRWEVAKALVKHGANTNQEASVMPLHFACIKRNTPDYLIDTLVKHGASLRGKDEDGWTPLDSAFFAGNIEVVKYFLVNYIKEILPNSKALQEFLGFTSKYELTNERITILRLVLQCYDESNP